jgi:hypothetical protein
MRIIVAALALWPGIVAAEDWQVLDGPAITTALTARVLGYPNGTLQDFFDDGRTLYGDQWGQWQVRGDRYCSLWPPSDRWACYDVAQSGLDIRFTADGGDATVGRYVDLN